MNSHLITFGTCKRFLLFKVVLKLTFLLNGILTPYPSLTIPDTIRHKMAQNGTNRLKLAQINTLSVKDLSFDSKKQPKTQRKKSRGKITSELNLHSCDQFAHLKYSLSKSQDVKFIGDFEHWLSFFYQKETH